MAWISSKRNALYIINAKALYSINTKCCMISMSTIFNPKRRGLYSAPSGVREGERKTARSFRGSGRGVGDWRKREKRHINFIGDLNHATNFEACVIRYLQRHPGLTHLSRKRAKWRRNAFGLNDRILQAKTHSPRQPRFALQPAKREWRWGESGRKRAKTKAPRQRLEALFWLLLLDLNQRHPD